MDSFRLGTLMNWIISTHSELPNTERGGGGGGGGFWHVVYIYFHIDISKGDLIMDARCYVPCNASVCVYNYYDELGATMAKEHSCTSTESIQKSINMHVRHHRSVLETHKSCSGSRFLSPSR